MTSECTVGGQRW